jgi:hypothetical protein
MSLFKNVKTSGRANVQFRAEAYNVFNHTQFSNVDTSPRFDAQGNQVSGTFGQVTAARTEANSNPEGRSMAQYGGQNQIDVMSIESVQEVQVVKGILPAEYGGVTGGQVNMISRSGTNKFHGPAEQRDEERGRRLAAVGHRLRTIRNGAADYSAFGDRQ